MAHNLTLKITHENDTWMARSSAIQGLLVTGDTLEQILEELPIVAQALFDVCQEKGWAFIANTPEATLSDIVWVFEVPHPLLQVA